MAETQAAKAPAIESEPQDTKREQSSIGFPYFPLSDAVKVAEAVHTVHGSACETEQAAAQMNESPTSSSFRSKVAAAKLFGLVTTGQGKILLTRIGTQICDDTQAKGAKAEAFLQVPLYVAIYDQFKGGTLPPNAGLESALGTLGVAQKQRERARQVFQRSAQEAGYFWSGTQRLVPPPIKGSAAAPVVASKDEEPEETEEKEKKGKPKTRHPLVEGLLQELPEPQSDWSTEERKKWLEMASTIFNVIYKDADAGRGTLRVTVEKNSAKP
jgi:hypothetical protein